MKLLGIALVSAIVVGAATAGQDPNQAPSMSHTDLWSPNRTVKDQNIKLISWGSGSIGQTNDVASDGAYSIRISTHNYFQGGILNFTTPQDLSKNFDDPIAMLQVTLRTADNLVLNGGGSGAAGGGKLGGGGLGRLGAGGAPGGAGGAFGPGGGPGGFGPGRFGAGGPGTPGQVGGGQGAPGQGAGPGGAGQGRFGGGFGPGGGGGFGPGGGGFGPGGGPGGFGRPGGANSNAPKVPPLDRIRVVIGTTDGKRSEAYLPLPTVAKSPWHSVAIPLSQINGFDKTNKMVNSIAFSGDATTTYYIGDIRVIHDPTPITGEMNAKEPLNLALGDTVQFTGTGEAGSTVLRFSWCFDSANGFVEDARGTEVKHKFRKAGHFVVTLKISDYYGTKAPFTVSVPVTVNP